MRTDPVQSPIRASREFKSSISSVLAVTDLTDFTSPNVNPDALDT